MAPIDPPDDDLESELADLERIIEQMPSFEDERARLLPLFERWREDLKQARLPINLKNKIDDMLANLQRAFAVPKIERETLRLTIDLTRWAEQLGRGDEHHKLLRSLFNHMITANDPEIRFDYLLCFVHHAVYAGDPRGIRTALAEIDDAKLTFTNNESFEMLAAYVASIVYLERDHHGMGEQLAWRCLNLAKANGYKDRIATLYSVLAKLYIHKPDPIRAFECSQMAWLYGTEAKNGGQIANGLHYMGVSLYNTNPQRGLEYLELANQQNGSIGDEFRQTLTQLSMGACHFNLKAYGKTIEKLQSIVARLRNNGLYKAQAHYMLGYAQAEAGITFHQAEHNLRIAEDLFEDLGMVYEQVVAMWVMAHLFYRSERYVLAVNKMKQVLNVMKKLPKAQYNQLLPDVKKDLEKYRKGREHRPDSTGVGE